MNTKHTPGPWVLSRYHDGDKMLFVDEAGAMIDIDDCTTEERAERLENARLIAASPDLLEALQWAVAVLEFNGYGTDQARAAIAKATGESQ